MSVGNQRPDQNKFLGGSYEAHDNYGRNDGAVFS
jgi:hypothetical protein